MRLFDETAFQSYGRYGYDLDELIALERTKRMKRAHKLAESPAEVVAMDEKRDQGK